MRPDLASLGRLRALLGPDAAGARQSLVALGLNSSTSLVAGAFLGAITPTLAKYPGLLVLVPAAIGLRGNIFGSFGNRLSTSIHAGTFRWSLRRWAKTSWPPCCSRWASRWPWRWWPRRSPSAWG
jgi:cation transporter-like permease